MRKKTALLYVSAVIGSLSLAAFAASPAFVNDVLSSIKQTSVSRIFFAPEVKPVNKNKPVKSQPEDSRSASNIPDRIIYLIFFNHLVTYRQHLEEPAARGEQPLDYKASFKKEMTLDDAQSDYMFQIAQDCLNEIAPLDQKAQDIIANAQVEFSEKGQAPTDPPQSLAELQQQKDETVLRYRDTLQSFLGDVKFAEFNQTVNQEIAPQVTIINDQKGGAK